MKGILDIIKRAAVDAVRQTYPLELLFAKVVQEEDIPHNKELLIQTEQKRPVTRAFFIENSRIDNLEKGDRLVLLQMQGGQRFYILEVMKGDGENGAG